VKKKSNRSQQAAPSTPWLQSRTWDLSYVLATPLLCLLAVFMLRGTVSSLELWLGVLAFGAMGHHFPGFLRAYTDPQLFHRFKARFLLAPPLFFATVLFFTRQGLHGMILVVALWGLWHGMMQHYGFMRIYDAKLQYRDRAGARWDLALCLCWFAALVPWSPGRLHGLLEALYLSGVPVFPRASVQALPAVATGVAVLVTGLYLRRVVQERSAGRPPNPIKLVLCAGTFGFLLVAFVVLDDLLLGLAAWELYHDIQYLAIVWIFNRKVTESGGKSRAMRLLFRPGAHYVILYVLLCIAWGSVGYASDMLSGETGRQLAIAFILTSGLLHFYFDGFIWKVREAETSAGLGLHAAAVAPAPVPAQQRWRLLLQSSRSVREHAVFQPVLWCLVAALLYSFSASAPAHGSLELTRALAEAVPEAPEAVLDYGVALRAKGQYKEAGQRFEQALELDPNCLYANNELGILRNAEGRLEDAYQHFDRARNVNRGYAPAWNNLAVLFAKDGEAQPAETLLREAVRLDRNLSPAWNNLAAVLTLQKRERAASEALSRALSLDPRLREAVANRSLLGDSSIDFEELSSSLQLAMAASHRPQGPLSGRRCGASSVLRDSPTVSN